ncbi:hypothetical protein VNI00_006196 [Paramarasmius palmivorus]|uniref:RNA helicase n=1 Tax=Paramarasmius palmivorus TaxID=297713 RepID=A0AAW0D980_9AGAR
MFGNEAWQAHISSNRHLKRTKSLGVDPNAEPETVSVIPGYAFCGLCSLYVQPSAWTSHLQGRKHQASIQAEIFRSGLENAQSDKGGITVSGTTDFGVVNPEVAKAGRTTQLSIGSTVTRVLKLMEIYTIDTRMRRQTPFTVTEVVAYHREPTISKPVLLSIAVKQSHIGRSEDRLVLAFEDSSTNSRFIIARSLSIIVGDASDHQALQPKVPYVSKTPAVRRPEKEVVPGEPAPKLGHIPWVVSLPKSAIPADLFGMLQNEEESLSSCISAIRSAFIPKALTTATYMLTFKYLLWIEEFKMDREMEQYDIPSARLQKQNALHYLEVPGLAEKRPSVLVGDFIRVRKHNSPEGKWYEGGVHVVRLEDVGMKFHKSFSITPSERVEVRFKLNRYPMRRQHQALNRDFKLVNVMFPTEAHIPDTVPGVRGITLHNELIAGNPRQLQAIVSIMNLPPGSAPFIIFGPPGTGKTVTMVESILQVLKKDTKAKVLVCTPSNSAADLVVSRLRKNLSEDQLFRLIAPSRQRKTVPEDIKPYTYIDDSGHHSVHSPERVMEYRVIVSTCVSAAMVFGIGIPQGYYSHIFIDEAGQGTEPELMIAIRELTAKQTKIVLCGDPKQLGPVIRSGIARELGLQTSYLQRLMNMDVYDEQQGFGRSSVSSSLSGTSAHIVLSSITRMKGSMAVIWKHADLQDIINFYLNSKHLVSPKYPIVFHSVKGKDDREASSPSFFNIDEATIVRNMVKDLLEDRTKRIAAAEIGVIAPYRAQVGKIKTLLKPFAAEVKVGSVEEFQGQERMVIIVSSVRSSQDYINFDLKRTLGFVANPQRFNVAVTRAKALLMIVGDPSVLGLDPLWRRFLNQIHSNSGWKGDDIPWDPVEPVDEAGGYDQAMRERAQEEMGQFMEVMASGEAVDDEDDVVVDRNDFV